MGNISQDKESQASINVFADMHTQIPFPSVGTEMYVNEK